MDIARKWLPPVSLEDKRTMINALTGTDKTMASPLLRKYVELILPYKEILGLSSVCVGEREVDCLASGMIFFYGCLCYIMHFPKWGQYIDCIFYYNLLYILVDHYIDDIKVSLDERMRAIEQMYLLIDNPTIHKNLELVDPILGTIADIYSKLIFKCPNIKTTIRRLFESQIRGVKVQEETTHDRKKYYDIAMEKGGYTMQVVQDMISYDTSIVDASFHIGTIMQLIDDIADVRSDSSKGINTIATYEMKTKGKLDDLWYDIMERIDKIDEKFVIFKILYTVFALYLPDRHRDLFDEELWKKTTEINVFDYTYGCDGSFILVNAVMTELMAIIAIRSLNQKIETNSSAITNG